VYKESDKVKIIKDFLFTIEHGFIPYINKYNSKQEEEI
jgi:hypothetical protein